MLLPYQQRQAEYTTMIRQFGGLNRLTGAGENEFEEMENMSGDAFPLVTPRKARKTVKTFQAGETVTGFCNKGALVWTVESGEAGSRVNRIYINNRELTGVTLTAGEKQLIGMGCYVCIFPDGYYLNVLKEDDKGWMGATKEITPDGAALTLTPCMFEGEDLSGGTVSDTAPENPENGDVWLDTSTTPATYNIWNAGAGMWQPQSTVYVKIGFDGIDAPFSQWDGVSISGLSYAGDNETLREQVEALNMKSALIQNKGDGWISVAGFLDNVVTISSGTVTIERHVPEMDYITECNNRLWGCKFGVVGTETLNEIYACRLGDFKNWYAYAGVSTDSYAMSIGCEGPFTGAITYLGIPIFFKENWILKIYGEVPANFQLVQTMARGPGKGQGRSLITDGKMVFYRSAVDFCVFRNGQYPERISDALGTLPEETVTGGAVGSKLFFACERAPSAAQGAAAPQAGAPDRELLVFDTSNGLWHRETSDRVHRCVNDGHRLYLLLEDDDGVFHIDAVDGRYDLEVFSAAAQTAPETVTWSATTASIGLGQLEAKYPKKIMVRAKLARHSYVLCEISYDGGDWRDGFEMYGDGRDGFTVVTKDILPKRCMDFRLRFSGRGDWQLVSVAKTTVQGSDFA